MIKIKITNPDGPSESYEFNTNEEAIKFLTDTPEQTESALTPETPKDEVETEAVSGASFSEDSSDGSEEVGSTEESDSGERATNPVDPETTE